MLTFSREEHMTAKTKATDAYRKRSVKQIVVRFYPKDEKLYSYVKESGGSTFLKKLAEKALSSGE